MTGVFCLPSQGSREGSMRALRFHKPVGFCTRVLQVVAPLGMS